ncbi:MAG: response regulator [Chthonomonadales bacterium]|nr:response regulator [Chthonomonadales bacterium]
MAKKILVVDDEVHIPRLVRASLQRHGYEVETATDGLEALQKVEADRPDLIVLDVAMPNMDGFEVLRRLKANTLTCSIRVVMLTARDQERDVARGWQTGADAYLIKPFNPADLVAIVKSTLGDAGPGDEPPRAWPHTPTRGSGL